MAISEANSGESVDLSGKIGRGLRWSVANTVLVRLGNLATGILVARLLAPHDYGVFAVALILLNAALSMNELGVSLAVVKWPRDELPAAAPTVATIALVFSVLLYGACFEAAPTVGRLLGAPAAIPMIRVLCLAIVVDALAAVPAAMITREFMQKRRMVMDVVSFALGTVVILVLALQGLGAWAMVWGYLVSNAAVGVMGILMAPVRFGYGFRWEQAKRLTSFGMPLAGASVLVFLMLNVDYLVVGPLLGVTQLGLYLFAFNLCGWPVTLISSAIRRVSFAGFSRASSDPSTAVDSFATSSGMVMLVAAPACLILGTLARPLIIVVYGEKWAPSAGVLSLLCVMALVRIVGELAYDYLVAMGRSVAVLYLQGVWVVFLIPALYLGAQVGGIKGVGAGHAVVALCFIVPLMLVLLDQSMVSTRGLWLSWRGPLLASGAAGAGGLLATSGGTGVLNLLVGGLAAVLIYFLLMRHNFVTLAHSLRQRSTS